MNLKSWIVAGGEPCRPNETASGVKLFRAASVHAHLLVLVAVLLAALKFRALQPNATIGLAITCGLALALARAKYIPAELPSIRLLQMIGALSAVYSLLHYPLMPPLPTLWAETSYALILCGWVGSALCAILSYRYASFALVPPAFLVWSKGVARHVTGLPHTHVLDVLPLPEVASCIGFGLAISLTYTRLLGRSARIDTRNQFATLVLMFAIGIHLANYFWSAIAKLSLDGPWFTWVTFNNPLYIYLAALDLNHITFSEMAIAGWFGHLIDRTHILSNIGVFSAQALAIAGFLLSKRWLVILLAIFEVMHVSIALAAGANFWPWVFLNVAITAVVVAPEYQQPGRAVGLSMAAFIYASPHFASVAYLGWYDSGANNRRYFQAEDTQGHRYYVSSNFFTFYSYPISHWDYGVPERQTAFAFTGMNGGTGDFLAAKAGRSCDLSVLMRPNDHWPPPNELAQFIVNYHRMVETLDSTIGFFPYNFYPHHFYVRPSLGAPFDRLDKHKIVAYIFRRESSCLSWNEGKLTRRLVSTGEFRIDLQHE